MPAGYEFKLEPNAVAAAALAKGNWAVLALTQHIEIITLAHYRASIEFDPDLSELWKDVFRFHWMEESQYAILDELAPRREHDKLDAAARETMAQREALSCAAAAVDARDARWRGPHGADHACDRGERSRRELPRAAVRTAGRGARVRSRGLLKYPCRHSYSPSVRDGPSR
jgi:hypothetical protein